MLYRTAAPGFSGGLSFLPSLLLVSLSCPYGGRVRNEVHAVALLQFVFRLNSVLSLDNGAQERIKKLLYTYISGLASAPRRSRTSPNEDKIRTRIILSGDFKKFHTPFEPPFLFVCVIKIFVVFKMAIATRCS